MNEPLLWLASLSAGAAAGAVFFGGLYWTVRHGLNARQPALWFALSFFLRTAAVLAVLCAVGRRGFAALLFGVTGLLVVRAVVLRLGRRPAAPANSQESSHGTEPG